MSQLPAADRHFGFSRRIAFLMIAAVLMTLCAASARAQVPVGHSVHERQMRTRPQPVVAGGTTVPLRRTAARELTHTVFGYHPYWIADSVTLQYDFSLLSHLAYFAAEFDPSSGMMTDTHGWEFAPVVDRAQAAGVRVQLAVTNFGAGGNRSLLSSAEAVDTLVKQILAMLRIRNAAGVSIDFESVPSDQRDNLTAFFMQLDAALAAELPDAEISAAIPAVDWNDSWDVAALREYVDQFFLMGYDYFWSGSNNAGPVAPLLGSNLNVTRSVDEYLTKGVPPEQFLLGVPYYGYDWAVVSNAEGAATTARGVSRTYARVQLMSGVQQRQWSSTYQNPWFAYETANWRQLWYDDVQSLGDKYDLLLSRNLAGAGIWALGYDGDRPELWDLIEDTFTRVTSASSVAAADAFALQLFPQPLSTGTALSLRISGTEQRPVTIHVTDVLGRLRWQTVLDGTSDLQRLRLPKLEAGYYSIIAAAGTSHTIVPLIITP